MRHLPAAPPPKRLIGGIVNIAAFAAMFLFGSVYAQEAPDASPEAPDEIDAQDSGVRVFLEVEAPGEEPVDDGDTFLVHVMVSDVVGLSAFEFQLGYDEERVRPIPLDADGNAVTPTPFAGTPVASSEDEVENISVEGDVGQFLADSPRNSFCRGPSTIATLQERVLAVCAGVAPPSCLGGPPGVDGSGRLGTVVFQSRGGEMTDIVLVDSLLVLDDVDPCDPAGELTPVRIPHDQGGPVTVALIGGDSSSIWLYVVIVVVVVAVLGAGLAGFLLYQRASRRAA